MEHDLINNMPFDMVVEAKVLDADTDGSSVDLKGYRWVTFVAQIGTGGITFDSSNKIEFEVEESDDDSTFTDVADADLQGAVAGTNDGCFGVVDSAADDVATYECTYKGSSRYVRPTVNFSGTHGTGTPISVLAIRHGATYRPVS